MQRAELEQLVVYVLALRKEGGGFGATRRLPATVEDTFHAVSIFRLLEQGAGLPEPLALCRRDEALTDYLRRLWPGRDLDAKTVAQLWETAAMLGCGLPAQDIAAQAVAHLRRRPSLLTASHAASVLGPALAAELVALLGTDWAQSLRPGRATSEELMLWLRLQAAVGEPLMDAGQRQALSQWFRDCQGFDGGFGFLPGTTSFMENCHFCLRSLTLLGAVPRQPAAARAFILGCRTRGGSFGRRGRAAPFLDATAHALAALSLLAPWDGLGLRGA